MENDTKGLLVKKSFQQPTIECEKNGDGNHFEGWNKERLAQTFFLHQRPC